MQDVRRGRRLRGWPERERVCANRIRIRCRPDRDPGRRVIRRVFSHRRTQGSWIEDCACCILLSATSAICSQLHRSSVMEMVWRLDDRQRACLLSFSPLRNVGASTTSPSDVITCGRCSKLDSRQPSPLGSEICERRCSMSHCWLTNPTCGCVAYPSGLATPLTRRR